MILRKRTDFGTAIHRVLETLKSGEPYTLNKLAEETNLNFRTVKKILVVLESNQTLLSGRSLDVSALENVTIIRIKEKSGLAFYPENIQNLIIKTMYYPTSSREEEILVYLYLNKAVNIASAIHLSEDDILKELVEAEHVEKTNSEKYYLTSDGLYIAKGALKLYPELENMSSESSSTIHEIRTEQFVQLSIPSPPSLLLIRSKLQARRKMV